MYSNLYCLCNFYHFGPGGNKSLKAFPFSVHIHGGGWDPFGFLATQFDTQSAYSYHGFPQFWIWLRVRYRSDCWANQLILGELNLNLPRPNWNLYRLFLKSPHRNIFISYLIPRAFHIFINWIIVSGVVGKTWYFIFGRKNTLNLLSR